VFTNALSKCKVKAWRAAADKHSLCWYRHSLVHLTEETVQCENVFVCCCSNPLITVNESGIMTLLFPGATTPDLSICVAQADPGPGGLSNALTCNLLGPPGLVAGDLRLQETAGGPLSDIIRFNPAGTGSPGYPASVVFYSDNSDVDLPSNPPADTGFPTAAYTNVFTLIESSLSGEVVGAVYTPTSSQPGFVPGFAVTYNIIGDVPEPGTVSLVLIGSGLFIVGRRRF
jgi:hypothetical protein